MSQTSTTGGLDSVPATESGTILTTAPKNTGIKGDIPLDSDETKEILARMQEFLDQRESPFAQLMGGLNKAYATTYGPGAALEYEKHQSAQDKQAMDYRAQMGAYRAAQRQADSDAADYAKKMNTGTSAATSGAAPAPGAGLGASAKGTPTWDGMPIPESVASRLKEGKGNVAYNRAIINDWLKTDTEKATALKYNADMRDMVTVMFEGKPLEMMRSQFEQFAKNNPEIARALRAQNPHLFPGGAGASAPGTGASTPAAAPSAAAPKGGGVGGGGAGIPGAGASTPAAAPSAATSRLPTSFPTPTIGGVSGSSKQGYEANVKLAADLQNQSMQSFMKNTYDPLAAKVAVQEDDVMIANDALEAIKTGNYGPGSGVNQAIMRAAKVLGIGESEEDAQQYLNNLTISRAKELFKASGARAAMGAQFTAQEAENFGKTLADITDPKEYIKAVYQVRAAMAEINAAKKEYLDQHPNNMPAANAAWAKSGIRQQMLTEKVDYLRERANRQSGKGSQTAATAPSNIPAAERDEAMLWLKNNPNDKRAKAVREKLGIQ
jgi:hypothetical protein